jgi:hypothetical protein
MEKIWFLQTTCGRIGAQEEVNMLSPSEKCFIDPCCTLQASQRLSERNRHVGRTRNGRKSKEGDYLLFDTVLVNNLFSTSRPNSVGDTCVVAF